MEGPPPTRRAHCPLHASPSPGCPGSPLGVGQPSPPSLAGWGTMYPLRSFPVGRGQRASLSPFSPPPPPALSLPPRSAPLASWSASSLRKARCSLLPSDLSSHSGGLFRDPRSPTHIAAVPVPKRANPGSSLSHPLYRGARGEPGEQTQQIAERESAEPARSARGPPPGPAPAAQTPTLWLG